MLRIFTPLDNMGDHNEFRVKASALLRAGDFAGAKGYVRAGLEKNPSQADLLAIAIDIYRSLDKRGKSLEYAELLIAHHPGSWIGYGRAAQDLCALRRLAEAQNKIEMGLKELPCNLNLLIIASDVYRVLDDREKSLECAEQLITHHPDHPSGYKRRIQDLVNLDRIDDAGKAIISFQQACVRDASSLQTCLDLIIATSKHGLVINTCEIAFQLLKTIEAADGKSFKTLLYRAKILAIDGRVGMVGRVLEENFSNSPETLSDLMDSIVRARYVDTTLHIGTC